MLLSLFILHSVVVFAEDAKKRELIVDIKSGELFIGGQHVPSLEIYLKEIEALNEYRISVLVEQDTSIHLLRKIQQTVNALGVRKATISTKLEM